MFNKKDLRILVTGTLEQYSDWLLASPATVNLVMGTIAKESTMGKYRTQLADGPAKGICQMEPATEKDIWENFLKYKTELRNRISNNTMVYYPNPKKLETNDPYAIIMCRIHYLRVKTPLPKADDIEGMARYWKQFYNTPDGKGTVKEFIESYNTYLI